MSKIFRPGSLSLQLAAAVVTLSVWSAPSAMADGGYGGQIEVSAKARAQLDAARKEVISKYGTPEKARAAGWRRPNSSTPTMGEHWGNRDLLDSPDLDPSKPEVLMFAPLQGELKLVGASWIKRQPKEDPVPDLFDGMEAMWHRHDAEDPLNRALADVARTEGGPRRTSADGIVMNHLWFIPAQDGEFTGHNHWLPFMDAGLPIPPDSVKGELLGQAALALGEVNGSAFIVTGTYDALPKAAQEEVDELRSEIEALVPDYLASHQADDRSTMVAVLGEMGAFWTDIRAIHSRELSPERAKLLDVAYGNMLSGHEHSPGGHP
ncbi:MAG: hypothetical protein HXY25_01545 [Alphaproteobacteria bacterium]|nr:hypothetical protein [Alphaproteobacteria bacterium]